MSKINSKISFKFQSKIFGPEANNKGKGRKRRHPSWTRWGRALEEAEADLPDTKDGRQASGGEQKEHSGLLSRAQIDFFLSGELFKSIARKLIAVLHILALWLILQLLKKEN